MHVQDQSVFTRYHQVAATNLQLDQIQFTLLIQPMG